MRRRTKIKKFFANLFEASFLIGIFSLWVACESVGEIPLEFDDVEMVSNETYDIPLGEGLEWFVEDSLVAEVVGHTIYAKRCGHTYVHTSDYNYTFDLIVQPVTLFESPYINWGCSIDLLREQMEEADYKIMEESENLIIYAGKYKEEYSVYVFENGALDRVYIHLMYSKLTSYETFLDFFATKYDFRFFDEDSTALYFKTYDQKTGVGVAMVEDDGGFPFIEVSFFPLNLSHNNLDS